MGRTGLSRKELNRVEVLAEVKAGSLRLTEAAERMGLSYRQAKRLWKRYRRKGLRDCNMATAGGAGTGRTPSRFAQRC